MPHPNGQHRWRLSGEASLADLRRAFAQLGLNPDAADQYVPFGTTLAQRRAMEDTDPNIARGSLQVLSEATQKQVTDFFRKERVEQLQSKAQLDPGSLTPEERSVLREDESLILSILQGVGRRLTPGVPQEGSFPEEEVAFPGPDLRLPLSPTAQQRAGNIRDELDSLLIRLAPSSASAGQFPEEEDPFAERGGAQARARGDIARTGRQGREAQVKQAADEKQAADAEKKRQQRLVDLANARVELNQRQDDIAAGKVPRPLSFRLTPSGGLEFGQTPEERAIIRAENTVEFQNATRERVAQGKEQDFLDAQARASRQAAANQRIREAGGIPRPQDILSAKPPVQGEAPPTEAEKQKQLEDLEQLSDLDLDFLSRTLEPDFDISQFSDADAREIRRRQAILAPQRQRDTQARIQSDRNRIIQQSNAVARLARQEPLIRRLAEERIQESLGTLGEEADPLDEFSIGPGAAFPGGGTSNPALGILANFISGFDFTQPDKFDLPRLPTFTPETTGGLQVQQAAIGQLVGLQDETRALEEQLTSLNERRQTVVDRIVPTLVNLLTKKNTFGYITPDEEAQIAELRATLEEQREIFDQEETQIRENNARIGARNLLTESATENPIGFSALSALGRIPEEAGENLRNIQNPFLAGLTDLNFAVPEGGVADRTNPQTLFGGALPTLGALGQIGRGEGRFLESVLNLTGTGTEDFARQAASVTPGGAATQVGRLFKEALPRRNR